MAFIQTLKGHKNGLDLTQTIIVVVAVAVVAVVVDVVVVISVVIVAGAAAVVVVMSVWRVSDAIKLKGGFFTHR